MLKENAGNALNDQLLMNRFDEFHTALTYQALSSAGLAIGTGSAAAVKIGNTVTYLNGGVFKSKTTAEVAFTATTHDIAPHATLVQEAVYLVCLAADGTPTLVMGAIASGSGAAIVPEATAGTTPIGYCRVAVAAGATLFDASTDLLSAAHITDTYVNLGFYCSRFDANI
jgi:hypothetical protein